MGQARPKGFHQLVEIEHQHEPRLLRLKWGDAHEATYPLDYVRGHCSCATCRGGDFAPHRFNPVKGIALDHIDAVGNYGVAFNWGDGHNTGIYTFERLRELCPCTVCRPDGVPEIEDNA